MEKALQDGTERIIGASYASQASEALRRRQKLFAGLVAQRKLPQEGWSESLLEEFVRHAAEMDSNNFLGNVGAGEREGRIASEIVRRRHFGLAHGIGRSGDIAAVQPKAAGSSLIAKICKDLVKDLLCHVLGMRTLKGVLLLPMATGMALSITLQCLRHSEARARPGCDLKFVLWPRIDQATCLKCVRTAGFQAVILENYRDGDVVRTDLESIERKIKEIGADRILGVLSTTSCFAPRVPDDIEGIAGLCAKYGIAHVINNAYGLQCSKCCHYVNEACRVGRVDAVIQSTDKNLMVPVGGSIVAGPSKRWIEEELSKMYPGRASMAPILDVFLTLMSLGVKGYTDLRNQRIQLINEFKQMISEVATKYGERILETSTRNTISFAITLNSLMPQQGEERQEPKEITKFGSMLFTRGISGARVVAPGMSKKVSDITFPNYGASIEIYPHAYVTLACALGLERRDLPVLAKRLKQTFEDLGKNVTNTAHAHEN